MAQHEFSSNKKGTKRRIRNANNGAFSGCWTDHESRHNSGDCVSFNNQTRFRNFHPSIKIHEESSSHFPSRNNQSIHSSTNLSNAFLCPETYQSCLKDLQPILQIPHDPCLNKEQKRIVESVLSGYSIFFTGPAGSGNNNL